MSRRSRRSRNIPKVGGIPLILLQVLVGALLAILLGVWLGKFYISRMLETRVQPERTVEGEREGEGRGETILPPDKDESIIPSVEDDSTVEAIASDPPDTLTARIPSIQFYRVQVGAFGQEENARAFLQELGEQGLGGLISASGDMYRVSVGLFTHKDGAEVFVEHLAPIQDVLDSEPLLVTETLPVGILTYSPTQEEDYEEMVQALGKTVELITKMESLWLSYVSGDMTPGQIGVELDGIGKEIELFGTAPQDVSPPTGSQLWEEVSLLPGDLEATLAKLRQGVAAGEKWMPFTQALARLIYLWPLLI